jgi:methylated-DNA-[protein]-cysteine S-methyltransferase
MAMAERQLENKLETGEWKWTEMSAPIGELTLCRSPEGLCRVEFGSWERRGRDLEAWAARWTNGIKLSRDDTDPLLLDARRQLSDYFLGNLTRFRLPLDMRGTEFQRRVWAALQAVPYGATASYKDIAEAIGQPKAVRAVGGANNRNPVPIIVPCHRIIGASGAMVGYGGGLPVKERLLALERSASNG